VSKHDGDARSVSDPEGQTRQGAISLKQTPAGV